MVLRPVERIPQPCLSVSGRTDGPAVPLGRCKVGRGMPLYLHEAEFIPAARAFGWLSPDDVAGLRVELVEARAAAGFAADRIAELEAELEKATAALTLKIGAAAVAKDDAK